LVLLLVTNFGIHAEVCDWKPSKLVGKETSAVVGTGAGATAIAGVGLKAAGIYSITHATTGVVMLGSSAAGASAAGTVGILASTGGAIGAVGSALISPFLIVPATAVAIGVGAFEGVCYFSNKNAHNSIFVFPKN
jgi:hypothetical protein